jgi:hypothetical protein
MGLVGKNMNDKHEASEDTEVCWKLDTRLDLTEVELEIAETALSLAPTTTFNSFNEAQEQNEYRTLLRPYRLAMWRPLDH